VVSTDSAAAPDKSTQRFCLAFVWLADENKTAASAYVAWGEKKG
jgi:peroxiredoxin